MVQSGGRLPGVHSEAILVSGGERGIRTLDRVSPIHAFQACAFNHSAISPGGNTGPLQFLPQHNM